MDSNVIVALISLLGTLGGSLGGILVSSKLTNYRLQQLENRVSFRRAMKSSPRSRLRLLTTELRIWNRRRSTMKIDWKRKLTSRKLWVALAGFVAGLIVAFGGSSDTAETVSGCILSGAAVVGYIIGEGLADGGNGGRGEDDG